jgi:3-dehydroquinate synthase
VTGTSQYNFDLNYKTSVYAMDFPGLGEKLSGAPGCVIIDERVNRLHHTNFDFPRDIPLLTLPAGEKNKTIATVNRIYRFLAENGVNRDSVVYVLGGGTITDVASFAVSTFKRGCRLINVPTTLLGMIDAAQGGKTSVNAGFLKNSVGTFYPAEEVIIVPEFLTTLAKQDLQNGLAEMLKLWFINPALSDIKPDYHEHSSSVQIMEYAKAKLDICTKDPIDRNDRRLLNLGHTFGHVLESVSRYQIPHGQAVAMGISIALKLSEKLRFIDSETALRMEHLLTDFGFGIKLDSAIAKVFLAQAKTLAAHDKKVGIEGFVLVLFRGYRQVLITEALSLDEIVDFLPSCIL